MMQVDVEKCTGCGSCLETCPVEAISLVSAKAAINIEACLDCGACAQACPSGAIYLIRLPISAPVLVPMTTAQAVTPQEPSLPEKPSAVRTIIMPKDANRGRSASPAIAPWARTAFAFVSQEVLPRVVEAVIDSLERRLSNPAAPQSKTSLEAPIVQGARQRQVRLRRRGGRRQHNIDQ